MGKVMLMWKAKPEREDAFAQNSRKTDSCQKGGFLPKTTGSCVGLKGADGRDGVCRGSVKFMLTAVVRDAERVINGIKHRYEGVIRVRTGGPMPVDGGDHGPCSSALRTDENWDSSPQSSPDHCTPDHLGPFADGLRLFGRL
ncbi:hypothetical protein Bbelb_411850 [Branchiostoma belcheri]|nr:hypothetical protein Bbelb_411850 [Branchiostoma belcheri]